MNRPHFSSFLHGHAETRATGLYLGPKVLTDAGDSLARLGVSLRRDWFADKPLLDNVADYIILVGAPKSPLICPNHLPSQSCQAPTTASAFVPIFNPFRTSALTFPRTQER